MTQAMQFLSVHESGPTLGVGPSVNTHLSQQLTHIYWYFTCLPYVAYQHYAWLISAELALSTKIAVCLSLTFNPLSLILPHSQLLSTPFTPRPLPPSRLFPLWENMHGHKVRDVLGNWMMHSVTPDSGFSVMHYSTIMLYPLSPKLCWLNGL